LSLSTSSANLSVAVAGAGGVGAGLVPGLIPRFSSALATCSLHSSNSFSTATSYASLPTKKKLQKVLKHLFSIPSLFRTVRSTPARSKVNKIRGLLKKQATIAAVLFFKSCALTLAVCRNNNSTHSGLSTIPKDHLIKSKRISFIPILIFTSTSKMKCCTTLIITMIDICFLMIE
jgi:hypothetical protein